MNSAKEGLNYPVDFLGASILYTVALAIGNTHRVKVREGWTENPVLYFALVGRPGTNKSHPLSFALKPIEDRDSQSYREYYTQKQEYEHAKSLNPKQRKEHGINEPVRLFVKNSLFLTLPKKHLQRCISSIKEA